MKALKTSMKPFEAPQRSVKSWFSLFARDWGDKDEVLNISWGKYEYIEGI